MKRFLAVLLIISVGLACSQKEQETSASGEDVAVSKKSRTKPRQMIPDEGEELVDKLRPAKGFAAIKPFFDANGTVSEKAVSVGETFDIFIIIEFTEEESMAAAEFKLSLPDGVSILEIVESDSVIMRTGRLEKDIMYAFRCTTGPKLMLVKYTCVSEEGFSDGMVSTEAGESFDFIGMVNCPPDQEKIPAVGGVAVLKKK